MTTTLTVRAGDRVMCLAPHPDDETLAAAGIMQQAVAAGAALRVVFATDGENNPWAQRAVEHRWRLGAVDRARWGARRRREASEALAVLGVPASAVAFLGLPDQGLTHELLYGGDDAIGSVAREIERFAPTILLSPDPGDRHPDHSALAVLLRFALERVSPSMRRPLVLDYVVHDHGKATDRPNACWRVVLSDEQVARKRVAIREHRSQLFLRPRSLLAFAAREETYSSPETGAGEDHHPIREVTIGGKALGLRLQWQSPGAAFGDATVHLAIDDDDGGRRLRIRVPQVAGLVSVVDIAEEAPIAQALASGSPFDRVLCVPSLVFRRATSMFGKVTRPHIGFFDVSGWRRIPLPRERDGRHERPMGAMAVAAAALR